MKKLFLFWKENLVYHWNFIVYFLKNFFFLIFNFNFIFIKGDDIDSSTNCNFYNQRNQNNYEKIEWLKVSKEIIDVCIALASIDLPAYVLLEIIDCFDFYCFVEHKMKIEMIINVKKSISKIFELRKINKC